jgi:hypothetical protein
MALMDVETTWTDVGVPSLTVEMARLKVEVRPAVVAAARLNVTGERTAAAVRPVKVDFRRAVAWGSGRVPNVVW